MSVTMLKPTRISGSLWRLRFSSTLADPTFYVYINSAQSDTTKCNCSDLRVNPGDQIEVTDVEAQTPQAAAEGFVDFLWDSVATATKYRIEIEGPPATWSTLRLIAAVPGAQTKFRTAQLGATVASSFRVVAIDSAENESTPKAVTVTVNRNPAAPNVSLVFSDSTKKVTIAVAA